MARDYADETRLSARIAAQQLPSTGPDPRQIAFEAVAEVEPQLILEVGPGLGELAERMQRELDARVVAVDQSERMVELTSARGVEAIVGNVEDLPFRAGIFDCAVAAWMLYHVPNLDRAVRELRRVLRPDGRLVAVTNSAHSQRELWSLVGYEPRYSFGAENGEWSLLRHFTIVERRDVHGTVTFPDRDAVHRYVSHSPMAAHLADNLPVFDGPLVASRHAVVFVCEP
ncbi:MAG: class I SAM-dependent methyltransferase [Verrucomicrobiota bacterium]